MKQHVAVARRIRSILPVEMWEGVSDARQARRVRHPLPRLLQQVVLGLVSGAETLRDVERLGQQIRHRRAFGLRGTPSDSRLYEVLRGLDPEDVQAALDRMVVGMDRSKQLEIDPELGLSLVAVDGKRVGNGRAPFHPECIQGGKEGAKYYQLLFLRAVHVGSGVKPVLVQHVVTKDEGEQTHLRPLVEQVLERHPGLLECLSVDAIYTTMTNMTWLCAEGVPYIAALKGNQEKLLARAEELRGAGAAEPAGGWAITTTEWNGRRSVTRSFARTTAMNGHNNWRGLYEQVWRLRQTVRAPDGTSSTEDRYYLTSLPLERLTPAQSLRALRAHWGIENDHHWTVDMFLDEDEAPWIRKEKGAEVLAMLRCIAYNLLRLLRTRSLRSKANRRRPWKELNELVRDSLLADLPTLDAIWEPNGVA